MIFCLTFAQQHHDGKHPLGPWVTPDGFVTVDAPSRSIALYSVKAVFGTAWSNLYMGEHFDHKYYPKGELGLLSVLKDGSTLLRQP